ncbi:outer membrane beta-barrel protein [Salibacter halophilus]|uniref:PorT family protein n=1 Tax=Salibacter halophilus TaxID=1803916 RepID=A0A6N6M953_9FLAO|nr:outer membrane beta-barrel protein [Salibacter halophilus]KAB1065495.1 PorT family protein [Salibacter halophilus]
MTSNLLKYIFLFQAFICASLWCTNLMAQKQDFGVKAGVITSTVKGQGAGSIKPGVQIGAYKTFGSNERLYIQLEGLLTQKGSWNWNSSNKSNINLYYLDVPIMFNIVLSERFNANIGFQPSLFIGGNHQYTVDGESQSQGLRNDVPAMDYSTLFGLEYEYSENFVFGIRYNHSFVPLQSYENDFADNNTLPVSMVAQFYAKMPLNKVISYIKKLD